MAAARRRFRAETYGIEFPTFYPLLCELSTDFPHLCGFGCMIFHSVDVPAGFMLVSLYIYEYYSFYLHPASGFFFRFLRDFFLFCAFCPLLWTFFPEELACFSCIFS